MRVPRGWFALSNGALVPKRTERGASVASSTGRWTTRIPSYLVTLVAGEFAEIEAGRSRRRARHVLVPKGREADGSARSRERREMIEHFGKLLGVPYPWNKYAQVVVSDFIFGGMENTTATTMYEHILLDERAAIDVTRDDLIAHELAHQWFGDYVTCRDWSHGWLNEGFATFIEHVDASSTSGATSTSTRLQRRSRCVLRRSATGAIAAPSCARTTTRRSISSIATSTRRAGSSCTCCAPSSATTLFWKGGAAPTSSSTRGASSRRAT